MSEDKECVHIPKPLYDKAKALVEDTDEFSTVDELVEFLLREALGEKEGEAYTPEEEEEIKERLRSLGYI